MNLKKKLPMILTFLRFFLVIPFSILLLIDDKYSVMISFIIYIIASITDWLDGFLARKYDAVSSVGAFLDPLADKILTLAAFFIFSLKNYVFLPLYLVFILLFREYFVTMMRVEIDITNKFQKNNKTNQEKERKEIFVTSKEAKFKTAFQMLTIAIFYLFYAINKNYLFANSKISYLVYLPFILFSISILLAYYSSYKYIRNYPEAAFQTLSKTISTFFYTGYFPFASGTFASLLILIYYILLKPGFLTLIIEIIVLFIIGMFFSTKLEKKLMVKDPSIIIIDEIVGMLISFLPLTLLNPISELILKILNLNISSKISLLMNKNLNLILPIIIFFIFRFFDIFKPSIIKKVQKISGGLGIMIDDIISAICTILVFFIGLAIYIFI